MSFYAGERTALTLTKPENILIAAYKLPELCGVCRFTDQVVFIIS